MSKQAKLKGVIIGVGKAVNSGAKGGGHQIGYMHGKALKAHNTIQLVAGADISAENLKAFQDKFEVPGGYTDYREMLAKEKPDVVAICTYMGLHRQMIEDSIAAGVKMICCEKPFVNSIADIRAIEKLAEDNHVKIVIAHIRRYFKVFQKARDIFQSGIMGKPYACIAGIDGWDLSEWGGHWIDMFRFFNNDIPVRHVFGQVRTRDLRGYGHAMEDHAIAYFEFENGCRGILDGGRQMSDGLMTLIGSEGMMKIHNENSMEWMTPKGRETYSHEWIENGLDPYAVAWDRMYTDLVEWHKGGAMPILGLPTTAKSCETTLAAYLSAVRTDRVDIPAHSDSLEFPVEILARRQKEKA
ncbi:Gfo/Idh/MocA family oxidoreductase [Oscillatoria amoena NRMC-F 0135]|uniref:Gfo/Idh/MocA family oxidoreductase n=1 Tax=Geitlerinema calcuttense NRMC-F 0142 TaxID=2922238 RepID=A0ABT7LZK7_9CYAN|nr:MULTISPECIES: Gfo/Idh/MocA family oxidoreductase [Cyanophyceae]MDL5050406.1 Gfo/Idh/MocA family oxidoreductase [Oscillatoria amoena NRMC-F 0135]MDL5054196.1 Gfo/Idh/MocA family oxidoreductase [Oscillatoria laete-virens NRMC-F 0139]MDL5057446.1 Gfo/Idh/MocA family oxidoreductase [Geitlerinema calcuttense NRMC-F 0142]